MSFIEVHEVDIDSRTKEPCFKPVMINVNYIQSFYPAVAKYDKVSLNASILVYGNRFHDDDYEDGCYAYSIHCTETYDDLKGLIAQAEYEASRRMMYEG